MAPYNQCSAVQCSATKIKKKLKFTNYGKRLVSGLIFDTTSL